MGFEETETHNIRTDVELLKKDVHSISRLVDKLDVAIDKLTDVTNCLNRMIAVQEEKIEKQEQDDNYLKEVITKIDKRVTAIERWKWLVVGGALVIGFAIAKYSVITQIIS
jgi:peptidoglycan hydrolase CwlO-like protein|tara:strand:+ start:1138 stop:1470 length:333 start_codon:yes stop_codon:yes gene_type:complete